MISFIMICDFTQNKSCFLYNLLWTTYNSQSIYLLYLSFPPCNDLKQHNKTICLLFIYYPITQTDKLVGVLEKKNKLSLECMFLLCVLKFCTCLFRSHTLLPRTYLPCQISKLYID